MENKTSPSEIRDWAHLPTVIVQLISEKINSITDFVRFRAVCLPWRSASHPNPLHLPPQLPWLMIPYYPDTEDAYRYDKEGEKPREDDGIRLFYDLWQSKMHKLHLPETIGKMCCASYRGWLVLVATRGTEVFLLNPLSRAHIQLPPFTTLVKVFGACDYIRYEAYHWFEPYIGNFVISKLSFSTDLTDPNCLIIVFLQRICRIFFCRVGDPCWTMVNTEPEEMYPAKFADAAYHEGRFYLLSHEGIMRVYDLNNPKKRLICSFQPDLQPVNKYLMEGELGVYMVVVRVIEEEEEEGEEGGEEEEEGEREEGEEEEEEEGEREEGEREEGEDEGGQEDQDDSSDDVEGTEKDPRMKIELYRFLEQKALGLQQVTDTRDMTIFVGDNKLCLAVSSVNWSSLDGGSMYIGKPHAGNAEGESCYEIYFTKLDDFNAELVVGDLGEQPRLRPAAPAMWFQPSFV